MIAAHQSQRLVQSVAPVARPHASRRWASRAIAGVVLSGPLPTIQGKTVAITSKILSVASSSEYRQYPTIDSFGAFHLARRRKGQGVQFKQHAQRCYSAATSSIVDNAGEESMLALGYGNDHVSRYVHHRREQKRYVFALDDDDLVVLCRDTTRKGLGGVLDLLLCDLSLAEEVSTKEDRVKQCLALQAIMNAAHEHASLSPTAEELSHEIVLGEATIERIISLWTEAASQLQAEAMQGFELSSSKHIAGHLSMTAARWLLRNIAASRKHQNLPLAAPLLRVCLEARFTPEQLNFPSVRDTVMMGLYLLTADIDDKSTVELLRLAFQAAAAPAPALHATVEELVEASIRIQPEVATDSLLATSAIDAQNIVSGLAGLSEKNRNRSPDKWKYVQTRARLASCLLNMAIKIGDADLVLETLKALSTMLRGVNTLFIAVDTTNMRPFQERVAAKIRQLLRSCADTQKGRAGALRIVQESIVVLKSISPGSADRFWLHAYCETSLQKSDPTALVEMLLLLAQDSVFGARVLQGIDSNILMAFIKELARRRAGNLIDDFMRQTGLLLNKRRHGPNCDLAFPEATRVDLLTVLAQCRRFETAYALYMHWTSSSPREYADREVYDELRKFLAPAPRSSQAARNAAMTSDSTEAYILQSSQVLSALCQGPLFIIGMKGKFQAAQANVSQILINYLRHWGNITNLDVIDIAVLARTLSRLSTVCLPKLQRAAIECIHIATDYMSERDDPTQVQLIVRSMARIDLKNAYNFLHSQRDNEAFVRAVGFEGLLPLITASYRKSKFDLAKAGWAIVDKYKLDDTRASKLLRGLIEWAVQESNTRQGAQSADAADTKELPIAKSLPRSPMEVAQDVQRIMRDENWVPHAGLLNALIQMAFQSIILKPQQGAMNTRAEADDLKTVEAKKDRKAMERENRKAAMLLLDICATHKHEISGQTVNVVLSQLQSVVYFTLGIPTHSMQSKKGLIDDIDFIVGILRWVPSIQTRQKDVWSAHSGSFEGEEEEGEDGDTDFESQDEMNGVPMERGKDSLEHSGDPTMPKEEKRPMPNRLSTVHFRTLYLIYLRLGDVSGAAEVLAWMGEFHDNPLQVMQHSWTQKRNKKRRSFDNFVKDALHSSRKMHKNPSEAKKLALGKIVSAHHRKSWWTAPSERRS